MRMAECMAEGSVSKNVLLQPTWHVEIWLAGSGKIAKKPARLSARERRSARIIGVWRSLVARFVRDEEAVGSNPATPTIRLPFSLIDPTAPIGGDMSAPEAGNLPSQGPQAT